MVNEQENSLQESTILAAPPASGLIFISVGKQLRGFAGLRACHELLTLARPRPHRLPLEPDKLYYNNLRKRL